MLEATKAAVPTTGAGVANVVNGDRAATERLAREPPAGASEGTPSGGEREIGRAHV